MSQTKQVIVLRTDLNMRKGKMVAQGSHAVMKVFFDRLMEVGDRKFELGPQEGWDWYGAVLPYIEGLFTKVVLGVESESDLFRIVNLAKAAGIPHALIQDAGKTEFRAVCAACGGEGFLPAEGESYATHGVWGGLGATCEVCEGRGRLGVPTYTAVALGPHDADEIDKITGKEGQVKTKLL